MKLQKLTETRLAKAEILERSSRVLGEGVLSRIKYNICNLGELNRNKRVYEKAVFEKVMNDPDVKEKLEHRSLYAHAEHPEGMQSSTEKIAGVVTDIQIQENNVYAIMEILDTPYGRICDSLLKAGCGLGVSTRAEGELEEVVSEGSSEPHFRVVPESYKFVTVDWTADPSTYGAFPESVEKDVTSIVKAGWEAKKIDQQYATCLLEKFKCSEAVSLCESIRDGETPASIADGKAPEDSLDHKKETNEVDNKKESPASNTDKNENKPSFEYDSNESKKGKCSDCGKEGLTLDKDGLCHECYQAAKEREFDHDSSTGDYKHMGESTTSTSAGSATVTIKMDNYRNMSEGTSGPHTVDLNDIIKEFEKIEIITGTTKISECKTMKEKTSSIFNLVKSLKESICILEAERNKLLDLAESDLTGIRNDYAHDVVDFTKKINGLNEQLEKSQEESLVKIKILRESTDKEKQELSESIRKEFEVKVAGIEKLAIDSTQKIYESRFNELKETFEKDLKEAKSFYHKKLMKILVELKVKEAGLESELNKGHLALLESLSSDKEIEAKLDEFRVQIREGAFHSNDFKGKEPIVVSVNETITEEQDQANASVGQMLHLAKSLK